MLASSLAEHGDDGDEGRSPDGATPEA